jgi:radical SAM protein with 4Fe4S-binding SPASM domain
LGKAAQGKLHTCTFPWYGLAVLSDGIVTPCPQDFFGRIKLGNALEQPLLDIWRNQETQTLRRAQADLQLGRYPVCLACDRVRRPYILGLPMEHLHNFLAESIFGWAGRLTAKPWKK